MINTLLTQVISHLKTSDDLTDIIDNRIYSYHPDSILPYPLIIVSTSSKITEYVNREHSFIISVAFQIFSDKKGISEINSIQSLLFNLLHNKELVQPTNVFIQSGTFISNKSYADFDSVLKKNISIGISEYKYMLSNI